MLALSHRCLLFAAIAVLTVDMQAADKPLVENDHVRITRVELAPDGTLPNDNQHDAITVQVTEGKTEYLEPSKLAKTEPSGTGQAHYFPAGSRRSIKNVGKTPVLYVQVQFLQPQTKYSTLDVPRTHYCNPDSKKACVTEKYQFCTERFCTETVELTPGAVSTQHTHDSDHIVIPTTEFTWREEPSGKAAGNFDFKPGEAQYYEAGVTHRLINVGKTTARMFVVQYK